MRLTGSPSSNTAVIVIAMALLLATRLDGQAPQESLAWAPVPSTPNKWIAPNKPHTKLVDLLASHKGQASWREPIVRDALLAADYVQMANGTKTPRQFQPDSPIWWIVQDGQVRFTIEGQEPFVATKGFLVQVPYRNVYQLEIAGNAPALFSITGSGSSRSSTRCRVTSCSCRSRCGTAPGTVARATRRVWRSMGIRNSFITTSPESHERR